MTRADLRGPDAILGRDALRRIAYGPRKSDCRGGLRGLGAKHRHKNRMLGIVAQSMRHRHPNRLAGPCSAQHRHINRAGRERTAPYLTLASIQPICCKAILRAVGRLQ